MVHPKDRDPGAPPGWDAEPTVVPPAAGTAIAPAGRHVLGGRYEIRGVLGRGGMGEVWLARDLKLQVEVALKALTPERLGDEGAIERLRAEVRSARAVASPHVCRVYDLVEAEGVEYVSMEYVDGTTLRLLLETRSPLPLEEAREIALQLLAGLGAIHEAGLVHRDVKPENVMLTRSGRVVLMDFGIAKAVASGGTVAGTPAYWAPEQAAGAPADPRADVFACGIVLAEMVAPSGVRGSEERQALWQGLREDPPRVPDTPWSEAIRKAVARDPRDRYPAARSLARALEEVAHRVTGIEEAQPYPGLASFTEAEAEYFFGREAEVEGAWKRLPGRHLLAVVGPSGAGKSSFLRAGLIPAKPEGWAHLVCTPGDAPFVALAQTLVPEVAGDTDAIRRILRFDEADVAVEVFRRWRDRHSEALVIVDQFEELFTLNPSDVQERFATLLSRLVLEADVHVLLSIRDDFLMHCNRYEVLKPLFAELMPLDPPTGESLRRALVQPALKCGYKFEDEGLVSEMLQVVEGERGALPLLAFAAVSLWDRRDREQGLLTRAAHEAIGGVAGALVQHAEATLERIGMDKLSLVRELFRNLVTAEGTRAVRDVDELITVFPEGQRAQAEEILKALIDARLLTTYEAHAVEPGQKAGRRVEVVHESLLTAWPRLVRWRTEDEGSAQLRDQLRQAAHLWEEKGKPEDLLWTGTSYQEYQVWRARYQGGLSEVEGTFAKAMVTSATHRRRLRRMAYAAAFAAVVLVAGGLGVLLRKSVRETRRAEAAKLLALGRLELDVYPTAAVAYARKSLELFDSPEARRFALEALSRGPVARLLPMPSLAPDGKYLDFNPRGDRLAVAGFTENAFIYRSDGGEPLALPGHPVTAQGGLKVAFVSDDRLVTGLGSAERLWIWSLPEGRKLRTIDLAGPAGGFWRLGGDRLLAARREREPSGGYGQFLVRSWRVADPVPQVGWRLSAADLSDFDFEVRSNRLWYATTSGDISVRSLDAPNTEPSLLLTGLGKAVGVRLRPAHDEVLSASEGEYRLWPLQPGTQKPLRVLHGGENSEPIVFDYSGRWFVSFERGAGRAQLWDLEAPPGAAPTLLRAGSLNWSQAQARFEPTTRWLATSHLENVAFWPVGGARSLVLSPEHGKVTSVAFSPGGDRLLSASEDGILQLWPMSPRAGPLPRDVLMVSEYLMTAIVDPSGSTAMASTGNSVVFVPLAGGEPREFEAFSPDSAVPAVAFDQDGRYAAAAPFFSRDDMKIVVWNRANDTECEIPLREKNGPDGYEGRVNSLAFAPDGSLYSAGSGGVRRWDVGTGLGETVLEGADATLSVSRNGRVLAAVIKSGPLDDPRTASRVVVLDLFDGTKREIPTHGSNAFGVALDATGDVLVTTTLDGVIQVGAVTGEEPHLLLADTNAYGAGIFSPDGKWIAATTMSGTIRLWPMPDLTRPPFHTLPYPELMAKLRELTNLHVVEEAGSSTGYKLEVGPFPGWAKVPEWQP